MEKYFVMVAGGGETSRANLEALMEDHYYANGANGVLVLPYVDKPSQAQVFAAQYAKDKNKDIVVVTNSSSSYEGMPAATLVTNEQPDKEAINLMKSEKSSAFLLWNDEDQRTTNLLALLKEAKIDAFDLTDGLSPIIAKKGLKAEAPTLFPVQELDIPKAEEADEDEEDEDEEDDEEEFEDSEEDDELYYGVQAFIKVLAKAIVEEMNKPQKGPVE